MHFLRTGSYAVAETFIQVTYSIYRCMHSVDSWLDSQEGDVQLAPNTLAHFQELHVIVEALRESDLDLALQ